MKKSVYMISLLIILVSFRSGKGIRDVKNKAFKRGEVLKYRVHYGLIDAGEAILEVKQENKQIGGRSTLHVVGTGKSMGAFDWFFKVRDRYESYIDEKGIMPWLFIRRVEEGGYKLSRDVIFNQYKSTAKVEDSSYVVPKYTQDILSSFYYARSLDLQNLSIGDTVTINTFFDYENFPLGIKYVGKELMESDLGDIRCLKFKPLLQVGRVFKEDEDMTVWISDDECKVPVRVQADVLVGSIKMDLSSVEGLVGSLAIIDQD